MKVYRNFSNFIGKRPFCENAGCAQTFGMIKKTEINSFWHLQYVYLNIGRKCVAMELRVGIIRSSNQRVSQNG